MLYFNVGIGSCRVLSRYFLVLLSALLIPFSLLSCSSSSLSESPSVLDVGSDAVGAGAEGSAVDIIPNSDNSGTDSEGEGPDLSDPGSTSAADTQTVFDLCDDGVVSAGESCEDGNIDAGDGCSEQCQVESGYECLVLGAQCTRKLLCGDGVVSTSAGETCDDGNATAGDGCSADCKSIETGFSCMTPGSPCASYVVCGDGRIDIGEACDDGNTLSGDGCDASCTAIELGWLCNIPGRSCTAECGDGRLRGIEQCDDRENEKPGCSDTCQLEPGYFCPIVGDECEATVCLNGVKEGLEACDDGNYDMGDGCTPLCEAEPDCSAGACISACGDGFSIPGDSEACDDGNLLDGDGCSSTCQQEAGYTCTQAVGEPPDEIALPVVYRDFNESHDDFGSGGGSPFGLVNSTLDADGKPTYNTSCTGTGCDLITNQTTFSQWYRDDDEVNTTVLRQLLFAFDTVDGTYQYTNTDFFPIDDIPGAESLPSHDGSLHNFHFTSEVRFWFEFKGDGSETLQFDGDDDVWVFVNGQLAVDIGGIHGVETSILNLGYDSDANVETSTIVDRNGGAPQPIFLGIEPGKVYEIVVFQAERKQVRSNYTLTLGQFNKLTSSCVSTCGDGIVTADELCDDGVNSGEYGKCAAGCQSLGPYCGDGDSNGGEVCDDGTNQTSYAADGSASGCAPGCVSPASCGDGNVDGLFGEQCDDGSNTGGYGGCNANCTLVPRCGDGQIQGDEACDKGLENGSSDCDLDCTVVVPPQSGSTGGGFR